MSNYLLDTNHVSPLVTHGHPLRQLVLEKLEQGHQFAVCVPVLTEVLVGISLVSRAVDNLATWNRLKVQFRCHLLDETDLNWLLICALHDAGVVGN